MPQIILIEKSTVIPATPARLYKSLTEAKQLSRWLADRVESDPRQGGQIVIDYDTREKRGEYRRLIPGSEVGISWSQFDELVPIDLTGFKLDRVSQGTRVRVVDFATPEDADELQAMWAQRLRRLKKLYADKPAAKKATLKKKPSVKRKTAAKARTTKRKTVSPKAKKK
ncbi:MAG TPA: SRPBCC domain-containing protein [Anaerolineae bacterium]|nr:SRPBCC domain-containing protein [Anaerolineae bacterium]